MSGCMCYCNGESKVQLSISITHNSKTILEYEYQPLSINLTSQCLDVDQKAKLLGVTLDQILLSLSHMNNVLDKNIISQKGPFTL